MINNRRRKRDKVRESKRKANNKICSYLDSCLIIIDLKRLKEAMLSTNWSTHDVWGYTFFA